MLRDHLFLLGASVPGLSPATPVAKIVHTHNHPHPPARRDKLIAMGMGESWGRDKAEWAWPVPGLGAGPRTPTSWVARQDYPPAAVRTTL